MDFLNFINFFIKKYSKINIFREKYESFLEKIDLLKGMDSYERSKIADALKPVTVKANEYVMKQVKILNILNYYREIKEILFL